MAMRVERTVLLRLDEGTVRRLERLALRSGVVVRDGKVQLVDVVRAVVERGMDVLEREVR